jgi:hypothetical protein
MIFLQYYLTHLPVGALLLLLKISKEEYYTEETLISGLGLYSVKILLSSKFTMEIKKLLNSIKLLDPFSYFLELNLKDSLLL